MKQKVANECGEFIDNCGGYPLIKQLNSDGNFIKKVKVRKKNKKDTFIKRFDNAFNDIHNNLHGRSIFCNGDNMDLSNQKDKHDKFYVFPIDGFKFLFNSEVSYHRDFQEIYNKMSRFMDKKKCEKVFVDLIEYSYKETDISLRDALLTEKEIIIFDVSYYYAIRMNKFPDYPLLIQQIKELQT